MTQNSASVLNATVLASIEKPGQSNFEIIELFDKGTGLGFIFETLLEFSVHQIFMFEIQTNNDCYLYYCFCKFTKSKNCSNAALR